MGIRYGAGRPNQHMKAEHCRKIDARRWAREGLLVSGRSGGWSWRDSDSGETLASISYMTYGSAVTLTYSISGNPKRQVLPILSTACNFGGQRFWFGCPRCGKRVANLFLRHWGFACRQCSRVVYASQSEAATGRMWRKETKIEARLGKRRERPKGMHRATYERLWARLMDCEDRRETALAVFLKRYCWVFE